MSVWNKVQPGPGLKFSKPFIYMIGNHSRLFLATWLLTIAGICRCFSQSSGQSPENLIRHLGWIKTDNGRTSVYLTESANDYNVSFQLPNTYEGHNEWEKFGVGAWLLATNGYALPIMGQPPQWAGYGTVNESKTADFSFQKTRSFEQLNALVLRVGQDTYVLKVRPPITELSAEAQLLFDKLSNNALEDLEAFEAGNLKVDDQKSACVKLSITGAKDGLKKLGVVVKWDSQKRNYLVVR